MKTEADSEVSDEEKSPVATASPNFPKSKEDFWQRFSIFRLSVRQRYAIQHITGDLTKEQAFLLWADGLEHVSLSEHDSLVVMNERFNQLIKQMYNPEITDIDLNQSFSNLETDYHNYVNGLDLHQSVKPDINKLLLFPSPNARTLLSHFIRSKRFRLVQVVYVATFGMRKSWSYSNADGTLPIQQLFMQDSEGKKIIEDMYRSILSWDNAEKLLFQVDDYGSTGLIVAIEYLYNLDAFFEALEENGISINDCIQNVLMYAFWAQENRYQRLRLLSAKLGTFNRQLDDLEKDGVNVLGLILESKCDWVPLYRFVKLHFGTEKTVLYFTRLFRSNKHFFIPSEVIVELVVELANDKDLLTALCQSPSNNIFYFLLHQLMIYSRSRIEENYINTRINSIIKAMSDWPNFEKNCNGLINFVMNQEKTIANYPYMQLIMHAFEPYLNNVQFNEASPVTLIQNLIYYVKSNQRQESVNPNGRAFLIHYAGQCKFDKNLSAKVFDIISQSEAGSNRTSFDFTLLIVIGRMLPKVRALYERAVVARIVNGNSWGDLKLLCDYGFKLKKETILPLSTNIIYTIRRLAIQHDDHIDILHDIIFNVVYWSHRKNLMGLIFEKLLAPIPDLQQPFKVDLLFKFVEHKKVKNYFLRHYKAIRENTDSKCHAVLDKIQSEVMQSKDTTKTGFRRGFFPSSSVSDSAGPGPVDDTPSASEEDHSYSPR